MRLQPSICARQNARITSRLLVLSLPKPRPSSTNKTLVEQYRRRRHNDNRARRLVSVHSLHVA
jgi:hypothetical protein